MTKHPILDSLGIEIGNIHLITGPAPVSPNFYVPEGKVIKLSVAGIEMTIKNTREQNVYVRIK